MLNIERTLYSCYAIDFEFDNRSYQFDSSLRFDNPNVRYKPHFSDKYYYLTGDTVVPAKKIGLAVAGPRSLKKRRSVREGRSADVGVSGIYEVVSEADLQFGPSTTKESVTVFSGRIREEVT